MDHPLPVFFSSFSWKLGKYLLENGVLNQLFTTISTTTFTNYLTIFLPDKYCKTPAYKAALLRAHAEDMVAVAMEKGIEMTVEEALRRIPQRLTKMRSHSFYRYFHFLKQLGWVEATGEQEISYFGGSPGAIVEPTDHGTTLVEVPQPRRFYRLTKAGSGAEPLDWSDPLQAVYHYPRKKRSAQTGVKSKTL